MISMTLPQYRRRECSVDGRRVHLKPSETEVLALLLVRGPGFMSSTDLIEAVWPNPEFEPEWAEAIIWRRIHDLRGYSIPIETAYSFGWRIPRSARPVDIGETPTISKNLAADHAIEQSVKTQAERLVA